MNLESARAGAEVDAREFSLVRGGPVHRLRERLHLSDDSPQVWRRPVVLFPALAWLPLLLWSVVDGQAWGNSVAVPFLKDVELHVRLLVALPLLVIAETVVDARMRPLVRQFLEIGVIPPESMARFDAALVSVKRVRDSSAELFLLVIVYAVGIFYVFPRYGALHVATWYSVPKGDGHHLSLAGFWLVAVSLPAFQFFLLRWYFRLVLWSRFLWSVTRCRLSLVPIHPDGAGGIGFLAETVLAFGPLLSAHGAWLAGVVWAKILYEGAKLPSFAVEFLGVFLVATFVALAPLMLFFPQLMRTRLVGIREYGRLANRYVREFDAKWQRGGAPAGEALLGSGDIQSLADMSNSFQIVQSMSPLPFGKRTLLQLAVLTIAPAAPLLLTMFSFQELLAQFVSKLF